jgi:hypothetical protein
MWGTDATSALTAKGPATIFVAVDHFTAECVGIHAARHDTRFEALEPLRQASTSTSVATARGSPSGWPCGTLMAANS